MPKLVVTVEDKLLSEWPLKDGEILIGRGPDCHIVVRDPLVSRHHAKIAKAYGGYFVEDLDSTNGVMANGRRVRKQMLKYGDRLQIGTHDICFISEEEEEEDKDTTLAVVEMAGFGGTARRLPVTQLPSTSTVSHPQPPHSQLSSSQEKEREKGRPHVRYLTGPFAGTSEQIEKAVYSIGEPGGNLAAISRRGQVYVLQHLGGKRITTINGEAIIGPSMRLKSGDLVQVGDIQLEFYLEV